MGTEWVTDYLAAWNSYDGAAVAAFMAEDVTYEDLSSGDVYEGRAAVQGYVEATHGFSSDYRFVVVSAQADGERYAIEWEMLGSNTGPSGGFPATGKPYRIRGASIGQLDAGGKIVRNRDYWNLAAYLVEIGLLTLP
jgi:steroid delta-isomerase-like uncharacterized protein